MKVAVVGSGIAGLGCAAQLHPEHEVTVFEAEDWIGGHTHTVPVRLAGREVEIDTGFIVFNPRTYPNFIALLDRLGVAWQETDMSFGLRCERSGLEYAGSSLDSLFAQRRNLLRPSFLRMVRDVLRFYEDARELLASPDPKVSLGDWMAGRGYGRAFVDQHLVPMGAAIWSAEPVRMLDFPALSFARFFDNHGLLQRGGRPKWRVVKGGSARYVEALTSPFRDRIRLRCPVQRVIRHAGSVEIRHAAGVEHFDRVVLATHSDQSLRLLGDATPAERALLGAVGYQDNEVVLHTDRSLLPRSRRAWAAWNYHVPEDPQASVAVTYHMNLLQGLELPEEVCVTLNHSGQIDPARVLQRFSYAHPVFDRSAIEAQEARSRISGQRRTHFCGAWTGYGFHEDGLRSGLEAAREIQEAARDTEFQEVEGAA